MMTWSAPSGAGFVPAGAGSLGARPPAWSSPTADSRLRGVSGYWRDAGMGPPPAPAGPPEQRAPYQSWRRADPLPLRGLWSVEARPQTWDGADPRSCGVGVGAGGGRGVVGSGNGKGGPDVARPCCPGGLCQWSMFTMMLMTNLDLGYSVYRLLGPPVSSSSSLFPFCPRMRNCHGVAGLPFRSTHRFAPACADFHVEPAREGAAVHLLFRGLVLVAVRAVRLHG